MKNINILILVGFSSMVFFYLFGDIIIIQISHMLFSKLLLISFLQFGTLILSAITVVAILYASEKITNKILKLLQKG